MKINKILKISCPKICFTIWYYRQIFLRSSAAFHQMPVLPPPFASTQKPGQHCNCSAAPTSQMLIFTLAHAIAMADHSIPSSLAAFSHRIMLFSSSVRPMLRSVSSSFLGLQIG